MRIGADGMPTRAVPVADLIESVQVRGCAPTWLENNGAGSEQRLVALP